MGGHDEAGTCNIYMGYLKGQCQATFYQKCPVCKKLDRNVFQSILLQYMGHINYYRHYQHTMVGNILSKFDQNLKSCLPTTFQDVKYNQAMSNSFCICYEFILCLQLQLLFLSLMQNLLVKELLKMARHCPFNTQLKARNPTMARQI